MNNVRLRALWNRAERVAERCVAKGIPVTATLERTGPVADGELGTGVVLKVHTRTLVGIMESFLDELDQRESDGRPSFPTEGAIDA